MKDAPSPDEVLTLAFSAYQSNRTQAPELWDDLTRKMDDRSRALLKVAFRGESRYSRSVVAQIATAVYRLHRRIEGDGRSLDRDSYELDVLAQTHLLRDLRSAS